MTIHKTLTWLALTAAVLHVVTEGESTLYWWRKIQPTR